MTKFAWKWRVSKGGCLELGRALLKNQKMLKNQLSPISRYIPFGFKCSALVVRRIEKLQREFLWLGRSPKKRFYLVDWASMCLPKKDGGLGIRPLRMMNQALLGKWRSQKAYGDRFWWWNMGYLGRVGTFPISQTDLLRFGMAYCRLKITLCTTLNSVLGMEKEFVSSLICGQATLL